MGSLRPIVLQCFISKDFSNFNRHKTNGCILKQHQKVRFHHIIFPLYSVVSESNPDDVEQTRLLLIVSKYFGLIAIQDCTIRV